MLDSVDDFGEGVKLETEALEQQQKGAKVKDESGKEEKKSWASGWRADVLDADEKTAKKETQMFPEDFTDNRVAGVPVCTHCGPVKSVAVFDDSDSHWSCQTCGQVLSMVEFDATYEQEKAEEGEAKHEMKLRRLGLRKRKPEETQVDFERKLDKTKRQKTEDKKYESEKKMHESVEYYFASLGFEVLDVLNRAHDLANEYMAKHRSGFNDAIASACVWRSMAENNLCLPAGLVKKIFRNRRMTFHRGELEKKLSLWTIQPMAMILGNINFVLTPLKAHDYASQISQEEEARIILLAKWIRNSPFLPHEKELVIGTHPDRKRPQKKAPPALAALQPVAKKSSESKREQRDERTTASLDYFFRHLDLMVAKKADLTDLRHEYDERQKHKQQRVTQGQEQAVPFVPVRQQHPFFHIHFSIIGPVAIYAVLSRRSGRVGTAMAPWSAKMVESITYVHSRTLRKHRTILARTIKCVSEENYFLSNES